jgi:hypothetical protein
MTFESATFAKPNRITACLGDASSSERLVKALKTTSPQNLVTLSFLYQHKLENWDV